MQKRSDVPYLDEDGAAIANRASTPRELAVRDR